MVGNVSFLGMMSFSRGHAWLCWLFGCCTDLYIGDVSCSIVADLEAMKMYRSKCSFVYGFSMFFLYIRIRIRSYYGYSIYFIL